MDSSDKEFKTSNIFKRKKSDEEIFLDITKILPGIVIETDIRGNINFISKKGIDMLGYTAEEIKAKTIWQLVAIPGRPRNIKETRKYLFREKDYPQEYFLIKKDQSLLPVECYATEVKNEKNMITGFRCILLDITSRKEYEEKIKFLSFHDKLTGLYNRAYFEEELQKTK